MRNFLVLALLVVTTPALAESLFQYGGKTYNNENLPDAAKQTMYDLESRYYKLKSDTIQNEILIKMYISEIATKKGKTDKEIEAELLKVSKPTDKEVKEFYEKNKARIPYPFEKVKNDIVALVEREATQGARAKLMDRIVKEKKVKYLLKEPIAPVVAIKDAGFARKGKAGSKVKIVEFADFQCPHCKHAADVFKSTLPKYLDKVEYVYIDYPINPSGVSRLVAKGAHCAGKQNKYWEFHYKAFDQQATLSSSSPANMAKELKLDEKAFKECYNSAWASEMVDKGKAEGERIGVGGTPSIFINGKKSNAGHDANALKSAIEKELKRVSS